MEMKLNVSWDVVASNSPTAKTRLLICRVSEDTLMINGYFFYFFVFFVGMSIFD